jgi:hypothetical protein
MDEDQRRTPCPALTGPQDFQAGLSRPLEAQEISSSSSIRRATTESP